jgi:hypothetical protein
VTSASNRPDFDIVLGKRADIYDLAVCWVRTLMPLPDDVSMTASLRRKIAKRILTFERRNMFSGLSDLIMSMLREEPSHRPTGSQLLADGVWSSASLAQSSLRDDEAAARIGLDPESRVVEPRQKRRLSAPNVDEPVSVRRRLLENLGDDEARKLGDGEEGAGPSPQDLGPEGRALNEPEQKTRTLKSGGWVLSGDGTGDGVLPGVEEDDGLLPDAEEDGAVLPGAQEDGVVLPDVEEDDEVRTSIEVDEPERSTPPPTEFSAVTLPDDEQDHREDAPSPESERHR